MSIRHIIMAVALNCMALHAFASTDNRQMLFHNKAVTEQDFRIPAIVTNQKGDIVALSDRRYTKFGHDVGYGEIDIQARVSHDNGMTWDGNDANPRTVIDGVGGEGFDCAHGDAAIVCDRETGRILLMCASGSAGYQAGGVNIGRYYSEDGGMTFHGGEMTENIPDEVKVKKFFSSGRICQSSRIKNGSYYRIYSGLCTEKGSQVVYSDNFGESWHLLGAPAANGNECKVEELPDGSVLLSCRISGRVGRMFSVFTYTNEEKAEGSWTEPIISSGITAASCNGEILLAPTADPETFILLQSVARSEKQREYVSIYWKRLNINDPYTSPKFYNNWDGYYQVSDTTSAYSTMVLDKNNNIAFIWEENNIWREYVESYDIMFQTLSLDEITKVRFDIPTR